MKAFWVLLFTAALMSVVFAADQPAPPSVGSKAPSFTLPNQEGAKMSLAQFKGRWVVLYFYPKDFTSGCTIEAHNFQRDIDNIRRRMRSSSASASTMWILTKAFAPKRA
jgi:peroxiredoxin